MGSRSMFIIAANCCVIDLNINESILLHPVEAATHFPYTHTAGRKFAAMISTYKWIAYNDDRKADFVVDFRGS
jgi:hypothetical protein